LVLLAWGVSEDGCCLRKYPPTAAPTPVPAMTKIIPMVSLLERRPIAIELQNRYLLDSRSDR
jgi:hypothetical protein